ncbi:MAG TPA: GNAT family protein [Thermomicrobiales bacterium]|nr:GNAT family protein [Thermomicrobiales bacterium]
MRPAWLTSDRYHLRPLLASDAADSSRWFPGPYPVGPAAAARWLEEQHRWSPWDDPPGTILAIVDHGAVGREQVVGSVRLSRLRGRASDVTIHVFQALGDEEQDRVAAAALGLVVPWATGELELMAVTVPVAADRPQSMAAAERCGMIPTTRLRQHVARPAGRVDLLWYQALNPDAPAVDRSTLPPGAGAMPGDGDDA